jgi:hypothetical protein
MPQSETAGKFGEMRLVDLADYVSWCGGSGFLIHALVESSKIGQDDDTAIGNSRKFEWLD